jgi:replication fork protection complex subunit Tof1/Swi1
LRRKKISGVIRNALLNEVDETAGLKKNKRKAKGAKEKGKKGKKRKTITIEDDSETDGDEEMRDIDAGGLGSDGDEAPEDTPMDTVSPLKSSASAAAADEDEEEEDIVQTRPARARLPFLDDSDSD